MVLTSHIVKRISVLFLGLSAALWVAKLSLRDKEQEVECISNENISGKVLRPGREVPKGVDQLGRGKLITDCGMHAQLSCSSYHC